MAAASLQGLGEEATCSICLEYFKDPVLIAVCGHNFCRACLTQYWKGSGKEEVSCPQCRRKPQRSLIVPNRQLANFVELTKQLRLQGESIPTEGKRGVCGKHREPLKLFCKEDEAPICVVCDRSKEHRDHDVVPVEEAAQDYKGVFCRRLELLEEERAKIVAYKAETGEESQKLIKQTKAEMENTKEQFKELHAILNRQEKLLLSHLEEVEKEIARKTEEHQARLSVELSSLGGLIQEMEEKCQQPPSELLQNSRFNWAGVKVTFHFSLIRSEEREPFQKPVAFPLDLRWKCWDVCDRNAFLLKKMMKFQGKAECLQRPTLVPKVYGTLDPETASERLILSEDCISVRNEGRSRRGPDHPDIFDSWPFVLGREGFTGGRHYWEVTVGEEGFWAVGVAKKSVQRKGYVELSTEKGIWAVRKWGVGYRASDFPKKYFLPLREKLKKIRVSLNYEGGRVAFHDADTGSHLYTFSGASFSGETLLPFFGLWRKTSLTAYNDPPFPFLNYP
ncbi:hypothetical protein JRQ81_012343 [Phrynocephalus forsythii]|uniref:Zinc finger protein RFP-like n=1 Tax=Phrynocephalus forsythii TaxID=171643 RepID=A0A9Q0X5N0_9SAUR|nr:hypothetical protein JRQ81_012343 [Phrynocephalus forsythii]